MYVRPGMEPTAWVQWFALKKDSVLVDAYLVAVSTVAMPSHSVMQPVMRWIP